MSPFEIPHPRIDPGRLPASIRTTASNPFAHRTFKVRIPHIVEDTIELNTFPDYMCAALEELRTEILTGTIRGIRETTPDREFWNRVSRPHLGRTWLEVPWYWAEAFFYRRVLEATRFFQPGAWHAVDPYAPKKQAEWESNAAPRALDGVLRDLPREPYARFERFLHSSLWGNRTDLSYNVAEAVGKATRVEDERSNLLVDDTERVWGYLNSKPGGKLVIITDNAGTELLMDLALSDFMLSRGLAAHITLHLKPQPFFVSDAMPDDLRIGLRALTRGGDAARAFGERVQNHLKNGRLRLRTHWSYATSLFYFEMPDDLRKELKAVDLVILKGDVNYRRLVGDVHWSPTTPFERATAYFPAPFVALRTLKAELILGLRPGQAERLKAQDPDWQVNGRRGLIQGRLSP